jgi:hypothetical protein
LPTTGFDEISDLALRGAALAGFAAAFTAAPPREALDFAADLGLTVAFFFWAIVLISL